MNVLNRCLIDWPRRVASHLQWLAPLFARIVCRLGIPAQWLGQAA